MFLFAGKQMFTIGLPLPSSPSLVSHSTLPQPFFPLQPNGHLQPPLLHVVRNISTKPQQFHGPNEFEKNNVGVLPPLPPPHICGLLPHIPSTSEILPQHLPSQFTTWVVCCSNLIILNPFYLQQEPLYKLCGNLLNPINSMIDITCSSQQCNQ